ncbi:MAG: DNA methylase [Blautia sp.]|nr:DNA methylase [Blautia sp.]
MSVNEKPSTAPEQETPDDSRTCICIDLKSFYASVECVERGLDPLTANLLVADESRSDNTICLAVSPSLKAIGVPARPRLFEARQRIREAEMRTRRKISYIVAPPRMALYIDYSARIYAVYLRYIAPEDIHVYSIDEVFIDATSYAELYRVSAHDLVRRMLRDVLSCTGITATAGIGTNLYLAKIAMDIVAKRKPADADGVRIAELDELSYRRILWPHIPLTDFWHIGRGISTTLIRNGMFTMGDVAAMSIANEEFLYTLFGIDAELLIDHAWGIETCTMEEIKSYVPRDHSLNNGQVLPRAYDCEEALLVVKEMTDVLVLDLVRKNLTTSGISLYIGYDHVTDPSYKGLFHVDYYGRRVPQHARGTEALGSHTNSSFLIMEAAITLFHRIIDPSLKVRRLFVTALNTVPADTGCYQLDLFTDFDSLQKEKRLQEALLAIKSRYGRNAVLRGMNMEEAGTTRERNLQIGGHKA